MACRPPGNLIAFAHGPGLVVARFDPALGQQGGLGELAGPSGSVEAVGCSATFACASIPPRATSTPSAATSTSRRPLLAPRHRAEPRRHNNRRGRLVAGGGAPGGG